VSIQTIGNSLNQAKTKFCGTNPTDNNQLQSVARPTLERQPSNDSIDIPRQNKNNKKLIIGGIALAAAAGGTILYVLSKGRFLKSKPLPEYINFTPATNIEEATEFAKAKLGIKTFKVNNLKSANWINEGLVKINNFAKGKSTMPQKVIFKNIHNVAGEEGVGGYSKFRNTLYINNKYFENLSKEIGRDIEISEYNFLLNKTNPKSACSKFSIIFHELGHANHFMRKKTYKMVLNNSITKEFISNKGTQKIIEQFFGKDAYASESPAEFIAETFANMVTGNKIPDNIMQLYKKYEGPMF